MRLKSLFLATALLITLPAYAADMPVAGTIHDPAQMPDGLYNLDPSHAHAIFFINHMGFSNYAGGFNDISGQLIFHPKAIETSKLNVTIKIASVAVNNATLVEHLEGPGFFDAAKYPDMIFVSRTLTATGPDHGTLVGDLTMHGVTKPVTLDVHFVGGGIMPMMNAQTMGFTATGAIKRSDFGMTSYLPGLGDDVKLDISAEFHLADSTPPSPTGNGH
jgi:polyisoprenoid-binding protein YceI